MAFNLKLVLKALLFSSSQPLSIKDIQTILARFHEQAARHPAIEAEDETAASADPAETRGDPGEAVDASAEPAAPVALAESGTASEAPPPSDAGDTAVEPAPEPVDDDSLYRDVPSLVTAAQIREVMDELAADFRAANDIYFLIDGAQGYRLVTHPRFARWIRIMRDEPPPVKLSQSALETLAVVAYRQPVTRSEIESIRGVSADAGLNKLLERELVYIVGRADLPGRPLQYGTTDKFLEFVGVKSLVELPASDVLSPRQIDEWLNRSANTTPPADAEMGLPLEDGEGDSPSLETVEVAHEPEPAEPVADIGDVVSEPVTEADPGPDDSVSPDNPNPELQA
ncbi:segregation and condensation protein B [Opitutaceae bacterium TAV1]|nr:segregation and condensation protein B [Opitutaceae bacterium TAV1]